MDCQHVFIWLSANRSRRSVRTVADPLRRQYTLINDASHVRLIKNRLLLLLLLLMMMMMVLVSVQPTPPASSRHQQRYFASTLAIFPLCGGGAKTLSNHANDLY